MAGTYPSGRLRPAHTVSRPNRGSNAASGYNRQSPIYARRGTKGSISGNHPSAAGGYVDEDIHQQPDNRNRSTTLPQRAGQRTRLFPTVKPYEEKGGHMLWHHRWHTNRNTSGYTFRMRILIHPHAHKHGITDDQIRVAYETGGSSAAIRSQDRDSDPPRWASIGFDADGRQIELVFVRLDATTILVFHANYATKTFRDQIRRGRI